MGAAPILLREGRGLVSVEPERLGEEHRHLAPGHLLTSHSSSSLRQCYQGRDDCLPL
jgi:hypothetical protein